MVKYIPAPQHPRPNTETRFTFRNRGFGRQLEVGDVLLFRTTDDTDRPLFVKLIKNNSEEINQYPYNSLSKKYGYLL